MPRKTHSRRSLHRVIVRLRGFAAAAGGHHARHSGGASLPASVGASVGSGPAPGAGSDDDALPSAKHSHVIAPAWTAPFDNATRAVGVSA